MRAIKLSGLALTLLFLAACVTINIYFPAAQAEQAAEKIVDDILGSQPVKPAEPTNKDKGASVNDGRSVQAFAGLIDFFIPSAHAAQPDFNVNTPEIRQLQASMKARHQSLAEFYQNGAIGFTKDAMVGIHDAGAISLKDKARVNNLLKDENSDRKALYQAIANANGHPEWVADVRDVFAKTWIQQAGKGWWYQASNGNWQQK